MTSTSLSCLRYEVRPVRNVGHQVILYHRHRLWTLIGHPSPPPTHTHTHPSPPRLKSLVCPPVVENAPASLFVYRGVAIAIHKQPSWGQKREFRAGWGPVFLHAPTDAVVGFTKVLPHPTHPSISIIILIIIVVVIVIHIIILTTNTSSSSSTTTITTIIISSISSSSSQSLLWDTSGPTAADDKSYQEQGIWISFWVFELCRWGRSPLRPLVFATTGISNLASLSLYPRVPG